MKLHASLERVDARSGRRECFRPAAVQWSSGDRWNGIRLERRVEQLGALPEGYWLRHIIVVYRVSPLHRERYVPGRGWQKLELKPWDIEILPAQSIYASRWEGAVDVLLLEVAPELLALVAGARADLNSFVETQDPYITHTALALEQDLRGGSPAGEMYGDSLGTALAAHLARWHTEPKHSSVPDARVAQVDRAVQYIHDNLDGNLSLQHLADVVQLDVYRFIRAFKQNTGLPPHQYVLRQRIERAKALLKDSALSVMEVALRSGFADQSHFTTAFRRATNLRPSEYRSATK